MGNTIETDERYNRDACVEAKIVPRPTNIEPYEKLGIQFKPLDEALENIDNFVTIDNRISLKAAGKADHFYKLILPEGYTLESSEHYHRVYYIVDADGKHISHIFVKMFHDFTAIIKLTV